MVQLELCLMILSFTGLAMGSWSISWARAEPSRSRTVWGRRLFVATLLGLGASGLVAALAHANGLVSLGLLAGLLLVAMLWEGPVQARDGA
jgi:hypothetical protein